MTTQITATLLMSSFVVSREIKLFCHAMFWYDKLVHPINHVLVLTIMLLQMCLYFHKSLSFRVSFDFNFYAILVA